MFPVFCETEEYCCNIAFPNTINEFLFQSKKGKQAAV